MDSKQCEFYSRADQLKFFQFPKDTRSACYIRCQSSGIGFDHSYEPEKHGRFISEQEFRQIVPHLHRLCEDLYIKKRVQENEDPHPVLKKFNKVSYVFLFLGLVMAFVATYYTNNQELEFIIAIVFLCTALTIMSIGMLLALKKEDRFINLKSDTADMIE